jgi:hypothetical protein
MLCAEYIAYQSPAGPTRMCAAHRLPARVASAHRKPYTAHRAGPACGGAPSQGRASRGACFASRVAAVAWNRGGGHGVEQGLAGHTGDLTEHCRCSLGGMRPPSPSMVHDACLSFGACLSCSATSESCPSESCPSESCPSESCPSESCPSESCPSESCPCPCSLQHVPAGAPRPAEPSQPEWEEIGRRAHGA